MSAPLAAFCLFLFALGQTSAAPIALVDGLGRAVALPEAARRVVSLSPSCTEALFAIAGRVFKVDVDAVFLTPLQQFALKVNLLLRHVESCME